ncbi:DUF4956 domain-containing protein [Gulosibacter chungangensis]|uniref:DUF4956 domain-containing protein n=1 Tax=Gulosibacter chungangensis TaxID=979746 RepID=A0A7J5B934_9MICO|nr:DUF4956 domain-containing protein [Gulosibacter chungangensis]KAB1641899.1 DUF4956 domain-containing protein [Gulosibacter chungangensis]
MTTAILLGADLLAIGILVFALFVRRHHRYDLVPAYLAVNVGVFAVTTLLSSAEIGMGVGLGLFGVLSIIRLRSTEIGQREVAYFFASLALGLIAGFPTAEPYLQLSLLALVLLALFIGDSSLITRGRRSTVIQLDRAIAHPQELREALAQHFGPNITHVNVQRLDLINDSTLVEVRYRETARQNIEAAPVTIEQLVEVRR